MNSKGDVSLPVMASGNLDDQSGGTVAKSRMEKRRFAVLLVVQTLMIVHVIQWLIVGTTIAPIEPSESIQTVREGGHHGRFHLFPARDWFKP